MCAGFFYAPAFLNAVLRGRLRWANRPYKFIYRCSCGEQWNLYTLTVGTNSTAYSYESFINITQFFGWLRCANHPYIFKYLRCEDIVSTNSVAYLYQ